MTYTVSSGTLNPTQLNSTLVVQRPIVIKLSRERSVGLCVGLSSALWKNGGSDPDAIWHHRSDGSRDEAGLGIGLREGVLLGRIWGTPL